MSKNNLQEIQVHLPNLKKVEGIQNLLIPGSSVWWRIFSSLLPFFDWPHPKLRNVNETICKEKLLCNISLCSLRNCWLKVYLPVAIHFTPWNMLASSVKIFRIRLLRVFNSRNYCCLPSPSVGRQIAFTLSVLLLWSSVFCNFIKAEKCNSILVNNVTF